MIDRNALAEFNDALPGRTARNSCSPASHKKGERALDAPRRRVRHQASARFRNSAIHASDGNTGVASSGLLSLDHLRPLHGKLQRGRKGSADDDHTNFRPAGPPPE